MMALFENAELLDMMSSAVNKRALQFRDASAGATIGTDRVAQA